MLDTRFFKHCRIILKSSSNLLLIFFLLSCTSIESQIKKDQAVSKKYVNNVRYGQLSNGFRYYIKSLEEPQKKLYLNFYVEAGSNRQGTDHPDLAHGVEHLAFKPTRNFPEGIYNSKKLNQLGVGMYDFGASSGPRITEYNFEIPESNKDVMDLSFLWFQDIANGMLLKGEDIDQVRGELRQEFLLRAGDDLKNIFLHRESISKLFPCSADYSDYFKYLETFDPTIVKQFYKDYYIPELMSLSVVGNIKDIDEMELVIKEKFGFLSPSKSNIKSKNCDSIFFNRKGQFHIIEENGTNTKEEKKVNIKLLFRDPDIYKNINNKERNLEPLLLQLLNEIVNQRILKKEQTFSSFDLKSSETFGLKSLSPALEIDIESFQEHEKEGLNQLFQILSQLKSFGVLQEEWISLKQKHLQYLSYPKENQSKYWVNLFADNLIFRKNYEPSYHSNLKAALENYSLENFNNYLAKFFDRVPEDILIIAPKGSRALSYSEVEVRTWIKNFMLEPITPYQPPEIISSLMNSKELDLLKSSEYSELGNGKSGAKEIILKNGIKLILFPFKPTQGFEDDIIKIHGFSLEGAKNFPKSDFYSALYAPYIFKDSGVKGLNKYEIERFLESKNISTWMVSAYIDQEESGIQVNSTIENMDTTLQYLYLLLTNPNKNKKSFTVWKIKEKEGIQDVVDKDFRTAIKRSLGDSTFMGTVLGKKYLEGGTELIKGLEEINLENSLKIYKNIFNNSSNFTYIVSGDFEIDVLLPIVLPYLGNLPNNVTSSKTNCFAFSSNKRTKGPYLKKIPIPKNENIKNIKYALNFIHLATKPIQWQEQIKVEALGSITNQKMWSLRFEQKFSLYLVGVSGKFNNNLNRYEISSNFECLPEEFDKLRKEALNNIAEIRSGIVGESLFRKGMDRMYKVYDSKRSYQHRIMHLKLYNHYRFSQPWVDNKEVENYLKVLTEEDIVKAAKKYYTEENLYEFIMK